MPRRTLFDTIVNCHPLSPTDSLTDSAQNCVLDCDKLPQLFDSSQTDSSDKSLDTSLPELLIEIETVQLMHQLLTQLKMKPSTIIHPIPFAGTVIDNILGRLENFDSIAAHNVWNDQKQLQVIPVYLKDTTWNFYSSLADQTKTDINLLKAGLCDRYHMLFDFTTCMSNCINYDSGPHYKRP